MIKQKYNQEINTLAADNANMQTEMAEIKNFVNSKIQENREMIMEI